LPLANAVLSTVPLTSRPAVSATNFCIWIPLYTRVRKKRPAPYVTA
jgi:hypothetical protein